VRIRPLAREELDALWSIDRAEVVENIYCVEDGKLVLRPEHHDAAGWPPGESELYGPLLLDCFDRGGSFFGTFEGETLVAAVVLESRFIGRERDQLQLKFLHVSRRLRGSGLGSLLFGKAVERARALGARQLYISATPSENTVHFYLHRGCRLAREPDTELFELEPEDIHLELELGT
jgi:predicted N-acetyltransferase YhbS